MKETKPKNVSEKLMDMSYVKVVLKAAKNMENSQQEQVKLTEFDKRAEERARHKALIMQIISKLPGLTHEQIREKEKLWFGYTFTTDNRLRELRKDGWVESREENGLLRWYSKEVGSV